MATKANCPCLQKVGDDEPIFVLRAQDKCAADIVRIWAMYARMAGAPLEKVKEAFDCADAMAAWPVKKVPD